MIYTLLAEANFKSITNAYGGAIGNTQSGSFFALFGSLISVLISILGVILLGFIVVAGFYWFTAGGDEGQIKTAKNLIRNSIIGLLLILIAVSLSQFIQKILIDNVVNGGAGSADTTTPTGSTIRRTPGGSIDPVGPYPD